MQLFYIVIICFVGFSQGFKDENPLLQALTRVQIGRANGNCGENGTLSNAKCLSQTKFIYNVDPLNATAFECDAGKVCVDLPGICFSGLPPLCSNTVPVDPAKLNCSVCIGAYACISQTSYAACSDGQPMTQYARQCAQGTFCNITASDPCAADTAEAADCSNTVVVTPPAATPAPGSGSGSSVCTTAGLFAAPGDATCKGYYSCYAGTNGQLVQTPYTCSGTLIFNPTVQRCVATTAYTCPT